MDEIITVKDVAKRFKTYENSQGFLGSLRRKFYWKEALRGVSLSIERGSIVALLGRNGSGKSTLVKLMSGIIRPDSGSVRVMGMDPWSDRIKVTRRMGVVFGSTHPQLFWDLPPEDTFMYVKGLYGIPDREYRQRLRYLVRILTLEKVYRRQTRQLSLGERMKCEFAAALLNGPELVIMDEPTVGVDLPSRMAISDAVLDMRRRFDTTFVITTHVVDDIANTDRIVLLDNGRLLFDGTQAELKRRFGRTAVLELFLRAGAEVSAYKGLGRVLSSRDGYIKLEIDPKSTGSAAFRSVFADKSVMDYRLSEPGLGSMLNSLYLSIDRKSRHGRGARPGARRSHG